MTSRWGLYLTVSGRLSNVLPTYKHAWHDLPRHLSGLGQWLSPRRPREKEAPTLVMIDLIGILEQREMYQFCWQAYLSIAPKSVWMSNFAVVYDMAVKTQLSLKLCFGSPDWCPRCR